MVLFITFSINSPTRFACRGIIRTMNSFLHCFKRSPTISRSDLDGFRLYSDTCSVIQPANGCSACRLLVKNSIKTIIERGLPAIFALSFLFPLFFPFVMEKDVLTPKQIILTSKRRAEHPFAVQNTQQILPVLTKGITVPFGVCIRPSRLFPRSPFEEKLGVAVVIKDRASSMYVTVIVKPVSWQILTTRDCKSIIMWVDPRYMLDERGFVKSIIISSTYRLIPFGFDSSI